MAVQAAARQGARAPLFKLLVIQGGGFLASRPVLVLVLLRIAEALWRLWVRRKRLTLGRKLVRDASEQINAEFIQGCLLSMENLDSLGRVEKRTLFQRPLLEVLGGNVYLKQQLVEAAQRCRAKSHNCMVARWLPPDERYFVLQGCLNAMSAIFGSEYVHFNGLDGDPAHFISSWYCLSVMTPTWPDTRSSADLSGDPERQRRGSYPDVTSVPRPSLRIVIVNESELKRVMEGKLSPPHWGFFNTRHAERHRMVCNFARSFQHELQEAQAASGERQGRSPFTSEQAHAAAQSHDGAAAHHRSGAGGHHKPDGGLLKRVHSVPNLKNSASAVDRKISFAKQDSPGDAWLEKSHGLSFNGFGADGGAEDSCFLRLHVPHFVGHTGAPAALSLPQTPQATAHVASPPRPPPVETQHSSGNLAHIRGQRSASK